MDIVDFWDKQITAWNDEMKCGLNWAFGAPLTDDAANIFQCKDGEKDFVHALLTNINSGTSLNYSRSNFVNGSTSRWNFTLHVVKHDALGKNNYDEIKDHPISESRWVTILKPLYDCLQTSPELLLQFCTHLGYNVEITRWEMYPEILWNDSNFTGWKINVGLQLKK